MSVPPDRMETKVYQPQHHVRIVTAASLFDGHDAAINIMRRILQATGAEVIHLGHNRSVQEVIETAVEEDVQGIAISSYQGGHVEYFKYMVDLLKENGAGHIRVFGGGGGVIVQEEIEELHEYGVARIFSPDDGMTMGLQGMINEIVRQCDFQTVTSLNGEIKSLAPDNHLALARTLTFVENEDRLPDDLKIPESGAPVIGITGTGGAGKSTLTDELVRRFLSDHPDLNLAVLSVDPTRPKTGGALLGDRIRMNAINGKHADRVFMRSFATRKAHQSVSDALKRAVDVCRAAGFDLIMIETAGIGQSDTEIASLGDVSLYVMTHDFGAPSQLEKIGMLDMADLVAVNKFDKRGSEDAVRDVAKQVRRNRGSWSAAPDEMPVVATMASRFNDPGVTRLYLRLLGVLNDEHGFGRPSVAFVDSDAQEDGTSRTHNLLGKLDSGYLSGISSTAREYRTTVEQQVEIGRKLGQALGVREQLAAGLVESDDSTSSLDALVDHWRAELSPTSTTILEEWDERMAGYEGEVGEYAVRDKKISVPLRVETLTGLMVPRVATPNLDDLGARLRFTYLENLPGYFPYTGGVFPFKRQNEDPTRMFAGEGSPERTNKRFHLVSRGLPAKRLSTAFDSVTLYGFDPHERPDIYGKVGNAGVSICTLDDMKKLYSGFNLCDPTTSVSMTINGPAPIILAMFMNTAIDQQVELDLRERGAWKDVDAQIGKRLGGKRPEYSPYGDEGLPEGHDGTGLGLLGTDGPQLVEWGLIEQSQYDEIAARTLKSVRGTVQADILKEDQAQNTCIFSTEFALRMMADVQESFIETGTRNYYSVSISGYHIAEAGANPITQLALTLANGFTYVEYYLSRGMAIDDFAPNLSFFFSNGLDPEYAVIGRVARRIWAVAMRERYGANERSQKLKYHIQTSGRSLHSKEIQFNDIRTTLQALIAVYDNCNSLHTNAYDEAITTPTEESVRRAMAIQMIINREFGMARNENPLQGSYAIDELTDLVEEAVLAEFDRLNLRGGVLGAMETMYQRSKIQEESMFYEQKKHSGALEIIGVNTFLSDADVVEEEGKVELMRSSTEEKDRQIANLRAFQALRQERSDEDLQRLQKAARSGSNLFSELMQTVRSTSLGQITDALFEVGGQYRRNM